MIFVDTGAWFASVVSDDPDHSAAIRWLKQNTEPLITTDYIIDETLTLLRVRGARRSAIEIGQAFFGGELATVYKLSEDDLRRAWETFEKYADKNWSFTDCASKVIIEKLKLTHAFTFDNHFRQFGSVIVVP